MDRIGSIPTLFDRHGAAIFRRCRSLLGSDDAAHDAVQDIFVRVLTKRAGFRGEAAPLTWLYSIATLHCLQQLRNRGRRAEKLATLGAKEPLSGRASAEDRLTIADLLADASVEVQQIVILRILDEMTADQVAAVLGLSRKTVAKKLKKFLNGARGLIAACALEPEVPA